MQFTIITILSLVAVAFAGPIALPERLDDLVARQSTAPAAEDAAMTDASGNVVSFNSGAVYLDATTKGN